LRKIRSLTSQPIDLTVKYNEIFREIDSSLDPVLAEMQWLTLSDDWNSETPWQICEKTQPPE
jgi:hypothetical protein